jgi:hypothetical protein
MSDDTKRAESAETRLMEMLLKQDKMLAGRDRRVMGSWPAAGMLILAQEIDRLRADMDQQGEMLELHLVAHVNRNPPATGSDTTPTCGSDDNGECLSAWEEYLLSKHVCDDCGKCHANEPKKWWPTASQCDDCYQRLGPPENRRTENDSETCPICGTCSLVYLDTGFCPNCKYQKPPTDVTPEMIEAAESVADIWCDKITEELHVENWAEIYRAMDAKK